MYRYRPWKCMEYYCVSNVYYMDYEKKKQYRYIMWETQSHKQFTAPEKKNGDLVRDTGLEAYHTLYIHIYIYIMSR